MFLKPLVGHLTLTQIQSITLFDEHLTTTITFNKQQPVGTESI